MKRRRNSSRVVAGFARGGDLPDSSDYGSLRRLPRIAAFVPEGTVEQRAGRGGPTYRSVPARCVTGRWSCSLSHERVGREIAEARMWAHLVVMASPFLDQYLRFGARTKPLDCMCRATCFRDELWPVITAQDSRGAAIAHEARQHFDHRSERPRAPSFVALRLRYFNVDRATENSVQARCAERPSSGHTPLRSARTARSNHLPGDFRASPERRPWGR